MLVAEIRRIFPTTVGLPMEISLYTSAVAVAAIECKFRWYSLTIVDLRTLVIHYSDTENVLFFIVQATVTPPLPKNFQVAQLLKSDINIRAAIAPR